MKVTVKWGKLSYDVELDGAAPVAAFKSQLAAVTSEYSRRPTTTTCVCVA